MKRGRFLRSLKIFPPGGKYILLKRPSQKKIDAILNLMEFSSRMKDYYDIYYLANKFDFDGVLLTEAMKRPLPTVTTVLP